MEGTDTELPRKIMSHVEDIAAWLSDVPAAERAAARELFDAELDDMLDVELYNSGQSD